MYSAVVVVVAVVVAFSSLARILGECSTMNSPPAPFFKVEISSRTLISLFRPGPSTVTQRAETTVIECSLASYVWDCFMPGQRHSQPTPTSLSQRCMHACLGVTCHLHFWQNDRSLLRATAVTLGVERTPNKSQHTKLTLEKKILPPLLPGFELATFRSRLRRSNQQAIPVTLQCNVTLLSVE